MCDGHKDGDFFLLLIFDDRQETQDVILTPHSLNALENCLTCDGVDEADDTLKNVEGA